MSDCSHGPVSTMPGHCFKPPVGTMCDDHPDRPATTRIQGETDSFGCEYIDCCEECAQAIVAARQAEDREAQECEWCKTVSTNCLPTRDYDEGMSGPVYTVCPTCRKKQRDAAQAELDGDYD